MTLFKEFQDFLRKYTLFKDFQGLENENAKFKDFQGFQGPVRTLHLLKMGTYLANFKPIFPWLKMTGISQWS